jgi:cell fate regulator YaaT (PSP1 superfamily)
MKLAEVQFNLWDKPHIYSFDGLDLNLGDYVIAEYGENQEIGKIVNVIEEGKDDESTLQITRKAELKDLEKLESLEKQKSSAFGECKKLITKHDLPMKLVDVHFSFDDKKVVFAFIAESRVDFRQLVKDLTRIFQRAIRLQQLGVRDEAKINGDIGSCGITQCCKSHLKELGNVSADQAELQQVSHRGAERLSGVCSRLKCCLRYENDNYAELSKKFPEVGSIVKTSKGKGEIIENMILKQTVKMRMEKDETTIVEIPLSEIK